LSEKPFASVRDYHDWPTIRSQWCTDVLRNHCSFAWEIFVRSPYFLKPRQKAARHDLLQELLQILRTQEAIS
jgi:hypothetical protein